MLLCSVLSAASPGRSFRPGPGSVLLRFDCVFRDRPGSAEPLRAGDSPVQRVLIHPAHRYPPALCCILYRTIAFHNDLPYHGSSNSGCKLVSLNKPYYIPFFAADKHINANSKKRSISEHPPLSADDRGPRFARAISMAEIALKVNDTERHIYCCIDLAKKPSSNTNATTKKIMATQELCIPAPPLLCHSAWAASVRWPNPCSIKHSLLQNLRSSLP